MTHLVILTVGPFRAGFYERPIMCFYLYRRSNNKKVTSFFKISSKLAKNQDLRYKKPNLGKIFKASDSTHRITVRKKLESNLSQDTLSK